MSQRYKMIIEYDGTPYYGWQSQHRGHTIQDALSKAIYQFCGENITLHGAGRTDSGVHAYGQVAHIDIQKETDANTIARAVNFFLKPHPISIRSVTATTQDFDARFSAIKRHYIYRIIMRDSRPVLDANHAWWVPISLDIEAMCEATKPFIGTHDFTTFRSSHCQARSPKRTLERLEVTHIKGMTNDIIEIHASARSFLHHQIRSIVGTLKAVGERKWCIQDVTHALKSCDRTACAPLAPAHGLFFMRVDY